MDTQTGYTALELDSSTAPTTPEGSLTFSPVLRPRGPVDEVPILTAAIDGTVQNAAVVRNICCVGAGYVGGPTAAMIAYQNPHIHVTVVDRDEKRIRRWNSCHPPIYEPGLAEIVRIARDGSRETILLNEPSLNDSSSECASECHCRNTVSVPARQPNLVFSTDVATSIAEADVVLIAVNTPTKTRGQGRGAATDMTAFEAVTAVVAQHARPGAIIVEKSTVPCRTAEMVREVLATHRPGKHFEILSNPEFLAAGSAMTDLLSPDRVLIGCLPTMSGRRAAEALAGVYAGWIPRSRIITTNIWSSELAKLVANAMLAQRISSINSIAAICEKTGADVDEIAKSIGCDPRIGGKFLKAGIGFGGSCFKKDILSLVYLARSLGLEEVAEYWSQVVKINEYSRDRFAKRIIACLNNTLGGKKVTLLGYAFKANTNDTRETPALEIIRDLLEEGPKEIAIFDPCCNSVVMRREISQILGGGQLFKGQGGPLAIYSDAYSACRAADAVLITTDFDEFRNSKTTSNTASCPDPRPFERLEPTQSDLLALQKHLATSVEPDPLSRYQAEPGCDDECPTCAAAMSTDGQDYRVKDRLDWAKISYHMRKPKWLFDGKGVIDVAEMSKLGVKVESVGRRRIA